MGRPFFRKRAEGQGGSPALGIFIVVVSFVLAIISYRLFPIGGPRHEEIPVASLAARLGPEYLPLRFRVLEVGPTATRVRMEFLDLSGKELSILERSVPGDGLALGFWLVPAGRGKGEGGPCLAFPRRFSSDGSLLYEAYSVSDFPAIYNGKPLGGEPFSEAERSALSSVLAALARADALKAEPAGAAAAAVSLEVDFASLEAGQCYGVWVSAAGKVSVRPCPSF